MSRNFVNIINHLSDIKEMIHDNLCDDKDSASNVDDGGQRRSPFEKGDDCGEKDADVDDCKVSENENENCGRRPTVILTPKSSIAMRERKCTPSLTPGCVTPMSSGMRSSKESVRTATKSRQEQIEKFNVHYMNTGMIDRSIISDMAGDNLQPDWSANSRMNKNPSDQSNRMINKPNSSSKKVSERKISAFSNGDSKNMDLDIKVESPEKRSRAGSSHKSERDHSHPIPSERNHSNLDWSAGSSKSKKIASIEDYGTVDYLMNDQTMVIPKKHKEHTCQNQKSKGRKRHRPARQDTVYVPTNCNCCREYKYKGSKTSEIDTHHRQLKSNNTILEQSEGSYKESPEEDLIQTRADLHIKSTKRSRFAQIGDRDDEEDDKIRRISLNVNLSVRNSPDSSERFNKEIKFDSQHTLSEGELETPTKFERFGVLSKKRIREASKEKELRLSEQESRTENEPRKDDFNDPNKTSGESDSEDNRYEERETIGAMTPRELRGSPDLTKGEFSFGVITRGQSTSTELGGDFFGFAPPTTMQNSQVWTLGDGESPLFQHNREFLSPSKFQPKNFDTPKNQFFTKKKIDTVTHVMNTPSMIRPDTPNEPGEVLTTEAGLIENEEPNKSYYLDGQKSHTQSVHKISPETSPTSIARTQPKPAPKATRKSSSKKSKQSRKSPPMSSDTSRSSKIQSRDLDSQNNNQKKPNRKKSPIHDKNIRKRIRESDWKQVSALPRRGQDDGSLSKVGVKQKSLEDLTIGSQGIISGIQSPMVGNSNSQGTRKESGITPKASTYKSQTMPGLRRGTSGQTAQLQDAIETLLDQRSLANTGNLPDRDLVGAISVLLGTGSPKLPTVGSQKRVQKMIEGLAREAKIAEEMIEKWRLKPVRKLSNNAQEQKRNKTMKELESTMIKGIKSGAIQAGKSFNPNGTYVPKAQRLERVMKKLQTNVGYQDGVRKDIKKFETQYHSQCKDEESEIQMTPLDGPSKIFSNMPSTTGKYPEKSSQSDRKTNARGVDHPPKISPKSKTFFSTLARGSKAVKQMLYNRTEDENHIDSERVGFSGNIADTLGDKSYEDHQKQQWHPGTPERSHNEKGNDEGDRGMPTLKINLKEGRKRGESNNG